MESSRFRMWHAGIIAAVALFLSSRQSAVSEYVWFWESINMIGSMAVGITALYYAARCLTHSRTHELPEFDRYYREHVLILAAAIVICGALI